MMNKPRHALTCTALIAAIAALPLAAGDDEPEPEADPAIPEHYELVYHQDFEGADPLSDFVFSDPGGWGLTEHLNDHALELSDDYTYSPPHRSPQRLAMMADLELESFVLEAQVRYTYGPSPHADLCLFFGFQDPGRFYYTHIAQQQDDVAHHVHVVDEAARAPITDGGTDGFDLQDSQWRKVRLVRDAQAGHIRLYVDDMDEPALTATDDRFQRGWVGLGSFDRTGEFDNILIWADPDTVQHERLEAFDARD